ncbi:MAG TPA: hypothetical protein PK052_02050 [Anaerohalosphaeraceae bacterium]|nr:hypothetical protein [Anaerohalosphaeraceae bacterium]HOL30737.1 hypothetical protein [Anaerohalosphaeraceae bacterium]HOM76582.1 hypothetical protein [Anaerohalosphaeraceae bacterium]HPC64568.1 hypothetical protein [Anaerohalosphaeraceae bacterium]HPO70496.1 hypothetical protein [Anaerohalosphaeraceae bacterium]
MTQYPAFYLISTAGFPNLGDEWITLGWLEAIFRKYPQAAVFLDVHFPSGFDSLIRTRPYAGRVCCVDFFWQLTYPYSGQPWEDCLRNFQDAYACRRPAALRHLSAILPRTSHLHFLGGGHVTGIWQHHLLLIVLAGLLKDDCRLPVYWTGGSLQPIEDVHLQGLLPFLSRFDFISFRDSESARQVNSCLPGTVCPSCDDIVLGLSEESVQPPAASERPVVLVNLQSDFCPDDSFGAIGQTLIEKICSFRQHSVLFWEMNPQCDRKGYQFLASRIPQMQLISFEALWKSTALGGMPEAIVHPQSYALGSRFHFHYYLAWHGIAGEFISQTSYYDTKHKSICEAGSGWRPLHLAAEKTVQPRLDKRHLSQLKRREFDRIYG